MERTVLFAGTFDPYTRGHHALVERALAMFDKVVVAVGRNLGKNCMFSLEERVSAIEKPPIPGIPNPPKPPSS